MAHGTQSEVTAYYIPFGELKSKSIPWKKLFDVDDDITNFNAYKDEIYLSIDSQE